MAKRTTKPANSNELDGKEFFAAIAQIEQEKGIKPGYMMKKITQITSRITAIGRRLEIRVPIFISFMYFVCAVARIIQIYADIGVTAFVGESPSL